MPAKKHKPEVIIRKLREIEIMVGQGGSTADACRRIAVSEQTYYRWRKEYGGLKTDQARAQGHHKPLYKQAIQSVMRAIEARCLHFALTAGDTPYCGGSGSTPRDDMELQ